MDLIVWNMAQRRGDTGWSYLLNDLDPAIALLQETTPPPFARERGKVVHHRAYDRHSWGSAVWVREGELTELTLPLEHRGWFAAVEVALPDQVPLVAVSVHARLVHRTVRPNIDRAFEAVDALVNGRRFIVGGDFNLSRNYDEFHGTTHHTEFLDGLVKRGYFDCHRKFHDEEEQTFWGRTQIALQDDHIFVSADLAERVIACDVVNRSGIEYLSDHSPLLLRLSD